MTLTASPIETSVADQTYLTVKEAAAYLRISPKTLERMRVEGTGPIFVKVGPGLRARVLYRKADMDTWLNGYAYASTSEYDP